MDFIVRLKCVKSFDFRMELDKNNLKYVQFKNFISIQVSLTLACPMDLKLFPLDTQVLFPVLKFTSGLIYSSFYGLYVAF